MSLLHTYDLTVILLIKKNDLTDITELEASDDGMKNVLLFSKILSLYYVWIDIVNVIIGRACSFSVLCFLPLAKDCGRIHCYIIKC